MPSWPTPRSTSRRTPCRPARKGRRARRRGVVHSGKDMRDTRTLIGTGGVFVHNPMPVSSWRSVRLPMPMARRRCGRANRKSIWIRRICFMPSVSYPRPCRKWGCGFSSVTWSRSRRANFDSLRLLPPEVRVMMRRRVHTVLAVLSWCWTAVAGAGAATHLDNVTSATLPFPAITRPCGSPWRMLSARNTASISKRRTPAGCDRSSY